MKNITRFFLLSFFITTITGLYAREVPGIGKQKTQKSAKQTADLCLPATGFMDLSINNVRARINTGGDMWWDGDVSKYEIPKGSGSTSMFSAALWMGGKDENGQLKLAALRYRQVGNDYWTGPLTIDGTAYISAETCKKYDKHFPITRPEVEKFKAWFADRSIEYSGIPKSITSWPAHGVDAMGIDDPNQALYLAPFYDYNKDGFYSPEDGDYPYYDFDNSLCPLNLPKGQRPSRAKVRRGEMTDTTGILVDQILKGDQTLWWVFNDKGNAHTETQGASIGVEIRAQAFAFTTNDEINNMTFYSYEIINRSTYTLTETYFSQWVDTDLGNAKDDYVGCDVGRGLGYCYNGDEFDEDAEGTKGYGSTPAAIGVDFFQGPYMDQDGIDNPRFDGSGNQVVDESINGINFGDSIIDNERFGMRRFVYHNNTGVAEYMTDPDVAVEYYNFLRGIWKDNTKMMYGGNGHRSSGAYGPECDFMFPDETDVWDWGTGGLPPNGQKKWTERTANNFPFDRRFMQSAGPFTLKPGAVNYITVGIPWARATSGGAWASVQLLRKVDDKCQALFDNCFKVLDGPDAPEMIAQEMDRTIVLYLQNRKNSNNYKERYLELDYTIPILNALSNTSYILDTLTGLYRDSIKIDTVTYDRYYRFEGYQVFQLADPTVSVSEIYNPDKARLVSQCDIKNLDKTGNDIGQLVNFTYNQGINAYEPQEMVNGGNKGINHSFVITEDQFATGDKRLVNHKKYYFIAIAYGYNQFMKYSQDEGNQQPGVVGLSGQKEPYKAGRKAATGAIKPITVIPHKPAPETGGTAINCDYGIGPRITRVEGQGNGGMALELTAASINNILTNNKSDLLEYKNGKGPLNIKIVDPLNVKQADYTIKFVTKGGSVDTARWILEEKDALGNVIATYNSDTTIAISDEKIFVDQGLGLSVTIQQVLNPGDENSINNGVLESSITYSDTSKKWLYFIPDYDEASAFNWIRSGTLYDKDVVANSDYWVKFVNKLPEVYFDPNSNYEKICGGTWAPSKLVSHYENNPAYNINTAHPPLSANKLENIASVDIVMTSDQSKWTRCPVVEMGEDPLLTEGGAKKFFLRNGLSVDKDGNTEGTGTGMSWFPGYAINVETGERLNIMFGEDSWLSGENGRDMKFNPTEIDPFQLNDFQRGGSHVKGPLGQILFGGKHWIYIMGHNGDGPSDCPAYDEGAWLKNTLETGTAPINLVNVHKSAMWIACPMAIKGQDWLSSDVKIRIRISKPYKRYFSTSGWGASTPTNDNFPMYNFTTKDIATEYNNLEVAKSALDLIRAVPNPYYGFSGYETNQLDNRIKVINLPYKCTVTIYTINGTIIKQFKKDDPSTYVEWDLKNTAGIPIAGGIYLIHINAEGVGEKIVKWFGALRPTDLNSF